MDGMNLVCSVYTDGDSEATYVIETASGRVYKYKTEAAMFADLKAAIKAGLKDGN